MRRSGKRWAALQGACGLALVLAACRDSGQAPAARMEFPAPRMADVRVGGTGASNPAAAIGRIVAARLTADGEHVVVLDYAPPYVKVFRRDGALDTAFLGRGGGPLEIRDPAALAVAGDSLILVADGTRRVAVFGRDGTLRAEGRTGFPVLTASAGCAGEWVAYGPAFQDRPRPSWLHRLRVDERRLTVEDLEFRDALGGGVIGNGLPYGIARTGDTVRVWHVLGATPSVLGWGCGESLPGVWPVHPLSARASVKAGGGEARMQVGPGHRTLAGMAAVPGGMVLAAHVVPRPGEPVTTELTLVTAGGEHTVAVSGAYTLRDTHPRRGVLVSSNDPVPTLFTVSPDDLRRLFGTR
jgi:hypothetical protein